MILDNAKTAFNGPHSYGVEPVVFVEELGAIWYHDRVQYETGSCVIGYWYDTVEPYRLPNCVLETPMFAHVLHSLTVEAVWPGDAADIFFQDIFAVRLFEGVDVYQDMGLLGHIREQIMCLCGDYYTNEELWYVTWSFVPTDPVRHYDETFDELYDAHNEADEVDTLNSELLLTEEYIGPEKLDALDSVSKWTRPLIPQRRVGVIQPIEQEE
jgi:hypothetical protein